MPYDPIIVKVKGDKYTAIVSHGPSGSGGASGNAFGVVNVTGQSNIVATQPSDTLRVREGSGIVITTDAPNDTITISATGGAAFDQFARDTANGAYGHSNGSFSHANAAFNQANTVGTRANGAYAHANGAYSHANGAFSHANGSFTHANAAFVQANTAFNQANIATSNADAAFARANAAYANANTAIYTASQIRANVSNLAPINYDSTNGVFSHANSGVTATTYGSATQIPQLTIDERGHITSASNVSINGLPPVTANGQLLIGNATSGTFNVTTLSQGTGIIITNGEGTVTISANGGSSTDQFARDMANGAYAHANGAFAQANIATTNADAAFTQANSAYVHANSSYVHANGAFNQANIATTNADAAFARANAAYANANTAIYTAAQIRANISNTGPINYNVETGVISHSASGVTATTYGSANQIPQITVDANGHITIAANVAINGLPPVTANGQLLIGNVTSGTFNVNTLTAGVGISIANGPGSIVISATGGGGSSEDQYARNIGNNQSAFIYSDVAANGVFTSWTDLYAAYQAAGSPLVTIGFRGTGLPAIPSGSYNFTRGTTFEAYHNERLAFSYDDGATISGVTKFINLSIFPTSTSVTPLIFAPSEHFIFEIDNTEIHSSGDENYPIRLQSFALSLKNGSFVGSNTINVMTGFTTSTMHVHGNFNRVAPNAVLQPISSGTLLIHKNILTPFSLENQELHTAPVQLADSIDIGIYGGQGTSEFRPIYPSNGEMYFDYDLNAPIWANNNVWHRGVDFLTANANGQLLIGNAQSGRFDTSNLTSGAGIIIQTGNGSINLSTTNLPTFILSDFPSAGFYTSWSDLYAAYLAAGSPIAIIGFTHVPLGGLTIPAGNYTFTSPCTFTGFDSVVAGTGRVNLIFTDGATLTGIRKFYGLAMTSSSPLTTPVISGDSLEVELDNCDVLFPTNGVPPFNTNGLFLSLRNEVILGVNTVFQDQNTFSIEVHDDFNHIPGNTFIGGANSTPIQIFRNPHTPLTMFGQDLYPAGVVVNDMINYTGQGGQGGAVDRPTYPANGELFFDYELNSPTWANNNVWHRVVDFLSANANGDLLIGNAQSGHFDTAQLTAGAGIAISTGNGSITISTTGGGPATDQYARDRANGAYDHANGSFSHANGAFDKANAANTLAQSAYDHANGAFSVANSAALRANTLVTDNVPETTSNLYFTAARVRANVSNVTPINYDSVNGVFSHANSGIQAGTYGNSRFVPAFTVNDTGHIESLELEFININASTQISSGVVAVNRGGTGQTAITVNGSILVGNTISGGYDVNTITPGAGIIITNGPGSITIAANVTSSTDQFARDMANGAYAHANGAFAQANIATSNADAAFSRANAAYANANTAIYTAAQIRANISNVAPINYNVVTGIISHADSGVVATTYGNTLFVSQVTVDATGHVTSASNVAIDQSLAQGAYDKANAANTLAQTSRDHANGAFNTANDSGVLAQAAFDKANAANTLAQTSRDHANGAFLVANSAALRANTLVTDNVLETTSNLYFTASRVRANISNVAPINYDSVNGIFSHALSGASSGSYGNASNTLSVVVDATGHITSIINTVIAIDASQVTTGILSVNRGGTGQTNSAIVNGALLIGNVVSGGYDVNTLVQGTGIIITNGNGSITISTTGGGPATDQFARDRANGAFAHANGAFDVANSAALRANTLVTDNVPETTTNLYFTSARVRANISNVAPINYNVTTGAISHADSGVVATTYGNTLFVSQVTVDAFGHVMVASNVAIDQSLAQGAYDKANGAFGHANGAFAHSNAAFTQANAANILAQTSRDHANGAFDTANSAYGHANGAFITANAAFLKANSVVQNAFVTINVAGQTDIVADSNVDTLTLVSGNGISITTNTVSDTITFALSETEVVSWDDFVSGGFAASSSVGGKLGWYYNPTGSGGQQAVTESGFPGIVRLFTGGTSGSRAMMQIPGGTTNARFVQYKDKWNVQFIVKPVHFDAATRIAVGLSTNLNYAGSYVKFEKLFADTSLFAVAANTVVTTRVDVGAVAPNTWMRLGIRKEAGNTTNVIFSINGNDVAQTNVGAPLPGSELAATIMIDNNAATTKDLWVDYFILKTGTIPPTNGAGIR